VPRRAEALRRAAAAVAPAARAAKAKARSAQHPPSVRAQAALRPTWRRPRRAMVWATPAEASTAFRKRALGERCGASPRAEPAPWGSEARERVATAPAEGAAPRSRAAGAAIQPAGCRRVDQVVAVAEPRLRLVRRCPRAPIARLTPRRERPPEPAVSERLRCPLGSPPARAAARSWGMARASARVVLAARMRRSTASRQAVPPWAPSTTAGAASAAPKQAARRRSNPPPRWAETEGEGAAAVAQAVRPQGPACPRGRPAAPPAAWRMGYGAAQASASRLPRRAGWSRTAAPRRHPRAILRLRLRTAPRGRSSRRGPAVQQGHRSAQPLKARRSSGAAAERDAPAAFPESAAGRQAARVAPRQRDANRVPASALRGRRQVAAVRWAHWPLLEAEVPDSGSSPGPRKRKAHPVAPAALERPSAGEPLPPSGAARERGSAPRPGGPRERAAASSGTG
jgi:hypothetical protein